MPSHGSDSCQRGGRTGLRFRPVTQSEYHHIHTGGLWGDDILLHGRFASASKEAFSSELLQLVGSLVRKQFKKIKAFYVGQAAERMLDSGKRLTIAVQSPRTIDLSRT
jgi:hypothetical protein